MHILVNSRFPVARESEDDFLVPVLVDIRSRPGSDRGHSGFEPGDSLTEALSESESDREDFLIGRVWMEKLLLGDAEDAGFSMVLVCDAAGATWLQVMETLTKRGGQRFRRDLQLDGFVDDILFLHELVLHPDIDDKVPLVDAAIRAASGIGSLVVTHHGREDQPLRDREYRELGFRKIASSDLLLRDNRLRYPFGDRHPAGRSIKFTASAEHETWMLNKWESLDIDFPAR